MILYYSFTQMSNYTQQAEVCLLFTRIVSNPFLGNGRNMFYVLAYVSVPLLLQTPYSIYENDYLSFEDRVLIRLVFFVTLTCLARAVLLENWCDRVVAADSLGGPSRKEDGYSSAWNVFLLDHYMT